MGLLARCAHFPIQLCGGREYNWMTVIMGIVYLDDSQGMQSEFSEQSSSQMIFIYSKLPTGQVFESKEKPIFYYYFSLYFFLNQK